MSGEIDWTPVVQSLAATNWTAVLVAVVSGCATVLGPFWLWKKQGKKESATVRASLLAEVAGIVEIVDRRGFLPTLRKIEALLRARQASVAGIFAMTTESYQVVIDTEYNRVYQANLSKLGVLSAAEARQVVRFHQLANSVRLDVISGGGLAMGTSNPDEFRETADLLEEAMKIGRALTALRSEAFHKWWRFWSAEK